MIHKYLATAAALLILAACGSGPDAGVAIPDPVEDAGEAQETSATDAGDPAPSAPAGTAPSAPVGNAPPPPELAPVYSAKITKVDRSAGDDNRYDVEIMFTSAQGRSFTAIVSSDQGALVYTENIASVPDAYYAHVFSFNYNGKIKDLNVSVIAPDEKTVLDKWDL